MTAVSLAELVGVTPQAISQYEHASASPSLDRVFVLAAKLNVPPEFLVQPDRTLDDRRAVFYRSRGAATKHERAKANRRLAWFEDIVAYVDPQVELPRVVVPRVDRQATSSALSTDTIDEIAIAARLAWGLGEAPIPSMVRLLENLGVMVSRGVVETMTIDAFSSRDVMGGHPCVYLGAERDSAARSRFDAAHELGHLILHADVLDRHMEASKALKGLEDEAHAFARAFLLPASGFLADLQMPTLQGMVMAKRRWGASIGVMIFRCRDLGLLKPWEANRLWFTRARRGWQRHEPLDDAVKPEMPDLLSRALASLVESRTKSRHEIVTDLRFSPGDIESLAGLPSGYLSEGDEPIPMIDRRAHVRHEQSAPVAVLRFPDPQPH